MHADGKPCWLKLNRSSFAASVSFAHQLNLLVQAGLAGTDSMHAARCAKKAMNIRKGCAEQPENVSDTGSSHALRS